MKNPFIIDEATQRMVGAISTGQIPGYDPQDKDRSIILLWPIDARLAIAAGRFVPLEPSTVEAPNTPTPFLPWTNQVAPQGAAVPPSSGSAQPPPGAGVAGRPQGAALPGVIQPPE